MANRKFYTKFNASRKKKLLRQSILYALSKLGDICFVTRVRKLSYVIRKSGNRNYNCETVVT